MSTPETDTATADAQAAADAAAKAPGKLYTFLGAQLVTRLKPPNDTEQVYQFTAQTNDAGIVFFHNFLPGLYAKPATVVQYANTIATALNAWAQVAGVKSIASEQIIDAQDRFMYQLDVAVTSTSGLSSTVIETDYPSVNDNAQLTAAFKSEVAAARAQLDAVENA